MFNRLPPVTDNDIKQLMRASGTPLEYLLSPERPTVNTKLGSVQIGSFLSYHVSIIQKIDTEFHLSFTKML